MSRKGNKNIIRFQVINVPLYSLQAMNMMNASHVQVNRAVNNSVIKAKDGHLYRSMHFALTYSYNFNGGKGQGSNNRSTDWKKKTILSGSKVKGQIIGP